MNIDTHHKSSHDFHGDCVNKWVMERELDNKPQPIIQHTQKYYEHVKNKSLTAKAAQLIKQRQRNSKNQNKQLNKTVNIEEISFGNKSGEDLNLKSKKTVTFGNGSFGHINKKSINQEQVTKNISNTRKYKQYFLQNISDKKLSNTAYKIKLEQEKRKLTTSERPQPKSNLLNSISSKQSINNKHPRTVVSQKYSDHHMSSLTTPIAKSTFSPLRSVQTPSKYQNTTSIKNRSKQGSRHQKSLNSKSGSNSVKQVIERSVHRDELRSILREHTSQIIEFLAQLIERQQ